MLGSVTDAWLSFLHIYTLLGYLIHEDINRSNWRHNKPKSVLTLKTLKKNERKEERKKNREKERWKENWDNFSLWHSLSVDFFLIFGFCWRNNPRGSLWYGFVTDHALELAHILEHLPYSDQIGFCDRPDNHGYNWIGALRGHWHLPSKGKTKYPGRNMSLDILKYG